MNIAGNDLDSIRALFSEKEKELSLAVAKVDSLTKQLEEIKRDRRGPLHLLQASTINNGNGTGKGQQPPHNGTTAVRELDKLRKELMVSNECQTASLLFFNIFCSISSSFCRCLCCFLRYIRMKYKLPTEYKYTNRHLVVVGGLT